MSTDSRMDPSVRPTLSQCPAPLGEDHITYYDGHVICGKYGSDCPHLPAKPKAALTRREKASAPSQPPSWQTGISRATQKELDRLVAQAEARAIFESDQAAQDDELVFTSLTKAPPVPDPTILLLPDGTYLIRKGWIHWFHGKGGSGKTPLAYMAGVEVVRAGGRVLIVDHEMGEAGAMDLLRDLAPDLTDEQIDAQVRYTYEKPLHTESIKLKMLAELDGFEPDLAIIDAVTGSMMVGSQWDAADVNRWFRAVPQWLRDSFGAAVIVIDHSNREDGPMPSGSARKHGAPQFRLWVRQVREFSPDHEDGFSRLEVRKERGRHARVGKVVAELRTVKGASFVLRAPDLSAAHGDEIELDLNAVPEHHQRRIDVFDRLWQFGADGSLTTGLTLVTGDVGVANRKALDWNWRQRRVARRKEPGKANAMRWWAAEFAPEDAEFYVESGDDD